MQLNWQENHRVEKNAADIAEYFADFPDKTDSALRPVIAECIEKAAELLPLNIRDQSMYLIFEWDKESSTLTIVVSDEDKKIDSPHVVRCLFSGRPAEQSRESDEYTDLLSYWIRDYLTTCAGFMRYSLVAIYHSGSRDSARLL